MFLKYHEQTIIWINIAPLGVLDSKRLLGAGAGPISPPPPPLATPLAN